MQGEQRGQSDRMLAAIFGLTVFLSAFLLFQVQPLISKVLLPWFGGTPSVWTTAMLVFQWLLFGGYAFAHFVTRRPSATTQSAAHLAVLVAGIALLPILPSPDWKPTNADQPSWHVVQILIASVGLPFFVLATTGPLMQAWYSRTYAGHSPYRLYSLSNAGSLLALLSYPFVVEPLLPVAQQSMLWSGGFVAFALCGAVVGFRSLSQRRESQPVEVATSVSPNVSAAPAPAPTWGMVATWFGLGSIPSAMMLAATNQVCSDVAPVPFLWLVPLSLYLISFILCFESDRWYSRTAYTAAYIVVALLMVAALIAGEELEIVWQVGVFFAGVFVTAMLCHGELNRLKPPPEHLTIFFLVLAVAGAAGGTFVGLLAPLLFNAYYELHVTMLAVFALVTLLLWRESTRLLFDRIRWSLFGTAGVATAIGLGYHISTVNEDVILATRNFYGVLRVADAGHFRYLRHGRIIHGLQLQTPELRRTPTLYYVEGSGVGLALRYHQVDRPRRIGLVGLGAGTLACYGRPDDTLRMYELDPDVIRIAQTEFSFLDDCPSQLEFVEGDARLALEAEREDADGRHFDILVVDAFSGDAIPVHLLTHEAMQVYRRRLSPDGLLALHLTNLHFDLLPVVADLAQQSNLASRVVVARPDQQFGSDSTWVLLAAKPDVLDTPALQRFPSLDTERLVRWTDDYCSLAAVLKTEETEPTVPQTNPTEMLKTGLAALDRGELPAAEAAFRSLLAANSSHAPGWLYLGNTLRRQKRYQEAARCYAQALALDDRLSAAHNNLGALLAASDPARAEHHFRRAIALDDHNAEAHTSLGNLLAHHGHLPQAAAHYEQALAIKPDLTAARQNLALVRKQLEQRTSPPPTDGPPPAE